MEHETRKNAESWREEARLLRAIAHPVRLTVLEVLCKGPQCVNDLNALVDISQPHLSQHMAALRKAGLVASHINGPLRCYYVLRPSLVRGLIRLLQQEHPVEEQDRASVIQQVQRPPATAKSCCAPSAPRP
jgi:ArsR family transcriptional regulator